MKSRKGNKYAAELAKIKEFRELSAILKKGDVENALLTNTSKDSEPVSENVIDSMLDSVSKGKVGEKDLELIEKLTTKEKRVPRAKKTVRMKTAQKAHKKAAVGKKAAHPQHQKPNAKKRRR